MIKTVLENFLIIKKLRFLPYKHGKWPKMAILTWFRKKQVFILFSKQLYWLSSSKWLRKCGRQPHIHYIDRVLKWPTSFKSDFKNVTGSISYCGFVFFLLWVCFSYCGLNPLKKIPTIRLSQFFQYHLQVPVLPRMQQATLFNGYILYADR